MPGREIPIRFKSFVDDDGTYEFWAGTGVVALAAGLLAASATFNVASAQTATLDQQEIVVVAAPTIVDDDPGYSSTILQQTDNFVVRILPQDEIVPHVVEDYWLPTPVWNESRPVTGFFADEVWTTPPPPIQDEDYYIPPLPNNWRPPVQGFISNEDEIVQPPPPIGVDDDPFPLAGMIRQADPLWLMKRNIVFDDNARPRPGLEKSVKSFNVTLGGIGSTITVAHGLLYSPQIIFAMTSGRTGSADANGRQSYRRGFGVAILPVGLTLVQQCAVAQSDDATSVTQSSDSIRSDCIIAEMHSGLPHAVNGKLSVLSIDATNVVFRIDQVFETDLRVQVQFIGGTDLTRMTLVEYTAPQTNGTQDIALGFKPDFLLFLGGHTTGDPENDSYTFLGACDKNLNQWVLGSGVNDAGGVGGGRAKSYCRAGECVVVSDTVTTNIDFRAQVSAFTSTGFTLNWLLTQAFTRKFSALAIQGANWAVGNFLSQTDTNEHAVVTGLTFRPNGELLFSAAKPASVAGTMDNDEQWSVSMNKDASVRYTQAVAQQNQVSPTVASTAIGFDSSYIALNVAGTVRARAVISSIQANGFSLQHSVADSSASFIGYIAFAPITPPSQRTVIITVKPKGGGDYLNLSTALTTEVANHRNLISENIILEFDCYQGRDTLNATVKGYLTDGMDGYITDRDHYIVIKAVEGHVGLPDESESTYLLDYASSGPQHALRINAYNVRVIQLAVKLTISTGAGASYRTGPLGTLAPVDIRFINCISFGEYSGDWDGSGFRFTDEADGPGCRVVCINCIVYDVLNKDHVCHAFNNSAFVLGGLTYLYNCTAYNSNTGFFDRTSTINKNCAAVYGDNGWNTQAGAPHPLSTNNRSTCGIIPTPDAKGTNAVNRIAVFMVDPLNNDIRPEGGDTGLTGGGANLYNDPDYPFNFDVTGAQRPLGAWTVGAFENYRPTIQRVRWAWVGAVTDASAKIKLKMNFAAGAVKLRVGTDPALLAYTLYGPVATANDIATFDSIATTEDTIYYYQAEVGGVPVPGIRTWRSFPRTNFPMSFRIACGGCSADGSNSNVFNAAKATNARIFIDYGDLHYYNIDVNDPALYREAFEAVGLEPKRRNLYDGTARAYVWDDHDYGAGNSNRTSASKPAAQQVYRETVSSYALPAAAGQIYQSFVIGRIRCILTDMRSERSPNNDVDDATKTMLGTEQKAWFKNELLTAVAEGQFILWFSTIPWQIDTPDGNDNDTWGGFTTERRELADFIQANNITGMAIMTGDMHAAVIDDGTHNVYTTDGLGNHLPICGPFPLNQTAKSYFGTWTQGPYEHPATRLMGVFGLVSIYDDGNTITLRFEVIDETGVIMFFTTQAFFSCFIKTEGGAAGFTPVTGTPVTATGVVAEQAPTATPVTGSGISTTKVVKEADPTFTKTTGIGPCEA